MLRGLYTAAAGMVAQQRVHDTVTNNIANINTPGYKQSAALTRSFPEMLLSLTGVENEPPAAVGRLASGVMAEESVPIQRQGDLMKTDKPLDFAIVSHIQVPGVTFDGSGKSVAQDGTVTFEPQAYFTLRNADGEARYTRGGQFSLNEDGYLVTADGAEVIGGGGQPLRFAVGTNAADLKLGPGNRFYNGTVDTGQALLISRIDNPNDLVREGDGKFRLEGDAPARPVTAGEGADVQQGYIERSNVDAAQSMVDLMTALRAYEANQKVVQYYDQSLDKAVNSVGRV
ncbi:flagellar hook-basal body protein [Paenibacillus beijingensis]|uniref:Flagellar basal body rod protein n=1 Tax=Paenibacillus beijingensis TaxID=1126833 RepID=A0A0D5NHZ7_9BACL|nr:flagellar hook-basal body protein [Paenibacillus beijingensis]AJY74548.1 flagellar basal body rod protein [Paenibacillus beijingensis]